jgi:hypothetical protein
MLQIFSWIQAHGVAFAVPVFTLASIGINAIAEGFRVLGKNAPSWLGSVSTFVGNVLHFINGNVTLK